MAGALLTLCVLGGAPLSAQSPTDLAGTWTLNRQLSQFPQEVGFSASIPGVAPGTTGGGRNDVVVGAGVVTTPRGCVCRPIPRRMRGASAS